MNILHPPIQTASSLKAYLERLQKIRESTDYSAPESSLLMPFDASIKERVLRVVADKKTLDLRYVLVVGIGGSNLGTKAIYDALYGYADLLDSTRYPKIIFLDTLDPEFLSAFATFFETHIHQESEVLVNIISKSGGTTETLVNAELVLGLLRKKSKSWKTRCVITTDRGSMLWKEADANDITLLEHPQTVGGRYSVLSPVGLFPLALCGVDIDQLLAGAADMGMRCIRTEGDNPAASSATILFHVMEKGHVIHDTFLFHPELESLGKWYRQLTGESLGKAGKGIFPSVSIGSNDLHSVVQLYLGGPSNVYTTFVYSHNTNKLTTPTLPVFALSEQTKHMQVGSIMQAIIDGTIAAYRKTNLPFMECRLDNITAYELGQFMQWRMVEIMLLAHLMGVNAFDQPQVELYKTETKKILAGK